MTKILWNIIIFTGFILLSNNAYSQLPNAHDAAETVKASHQIEQEKEKKAQDIWDKKFGDQLETKIQKDIEGGSCWGYDNTAGVSEGAIQAEMFKLRKLGYTVTRTATYSYDDYAVGLPKDNLPLNEIHVQWCKE